MNRPEQTLNILQIISKNDRYGAQRLFLDQAAALHRKGNRVIVVGRGEKGYVTDSVRAMGIDYYGIPMKSIKDIVFLIRLVKSNNIDVIHTYLDRADYFGIMASWFSRRPVVCTMNVRRYHIGHKLVDTVAVVSHTQEYLLVSKGVSRGKIHLVRPGIEVDRFANPDAKKRAVWKERLGIDRFSIVFCHIASMQRQKSHDVSLDLITECRQRGENPLLIIAGDPLHGEYYESLVKTIGDRGLGENVHFTGWTSELPELLSLSHFALLPSVHEAFGMVLLEGMAAGTPIVAREGEGGAELIEEYETGFLYRPDAGVADLAEKILTLWRDRTRYKEFSEKCKKVAQHEFTIEKFGERLMKLYQSLTPG